MKGAVVGNRGPGDHWSSREPFKELALGVRDKDERGERELLQLL